MKVKGAKNNKRFMNLVRNMSYATTDEIYETVVELCLQNDINCQELINRGSEFHDGNITEDDFRKELFIVIAN